MNSLSRSPIIKDLLSVVAVSTTIENKHEFSIFLIDEEMDKYDPTMDCTGYYNLKSNKLVVQNKYSVFNAEFVLHELAHKTMKDIFNHGSSRYNTESSKSLYHQALKKSLLNVQSFINKRSGLEIIFKDHNDTWKMGKTLSSILFPKYLEDNEVYSFVSFFDEYNFFWLGGNTPLGNALLYLRFELADALVKAGATIKPITLHMAAMINNSEILAWFLENKAILHINHEDCQGMTALGYARSPQIIKTLIYSGAVPYPTNFEFICSSNPECYETGEDLTIIKIQLDELEAFLSFYNQNTNYSCRFI